MDLIFPGTIYHGITRTPLTVVLDIDHTLVHTHDGFNEEMYHLITTKMALYPLRTRIYKINVRDLDDDNDLQRGLGTNQYLMGFSRPHYFQFLKFCFHHFARVIVWSAGRYPYVQEMVRYLFRGLPSPFAVLTYDDMVDKYGKYHPQKPLSLLADRYQIPLHSIVAIDDSPGTFEDNPRQGLLIPRYYYRHSPPVNDEDSWLLEVITFFTTVVPSDCTDITTIPLTLRDN